MAKRTLKAWADVGSHGGIFVFEGGPMAEHFPGLLQIYHDPMPGCIPVTITYEWPSPSRAEGDRG
jgi:hypothetical protein